MKLKENQKIIAIDFGGSSIKSALINHKAKIVKTITKTNIKSINIIEQISLLLKEYLNNLDDSKDIKAITIGIPGHIDSKNGIIIENTTQQSTIKNYNIVLNLESRFKIPVFIDNDVNNALKGEYFFGIAKSYSSVFMINIGSGIGGAFLNNGKIVSGNNYCAGEIGHCIVEKDGIKCKCGNQGCFELYASAFGIINIIKKEINNGINSSLKNILNLNGEIIIDAANNGDSLAKSIIQKAFDYCCLICVNLINLLNIPIIIFGGEMNRIIFSYKELTTAVSNQVLPSLKKSFIIVPSSLGENVATLGSVAIFFN